MARGFSVLPKRGIKITPGKEGKLLPEGSKFAIYGKKKPKLLPRAPIVISALTVVTEGTEKPLLKKQRQINRSIFQNYLL